MKIDWNPTELNERKEKRLKCPLNYKVTVRILNHFTSVLYHQKRFKFFEKNVVSMFIICNAFEVSGVFYCFICIAKKKKLPNSANFSLAKKGKGKLEKHF